MRRPDGPREETTRTIVRDGIAIGVATGAYGISFGAIGVASGLDVWQTCALSLLVFTGASQFALVGVIGSGGNPLFGAVSDRRFADACRFARSPIGTSSGLSRLPQMRSDASQNTMSA